MYDRQLGDLIFRLWEWKTEEQFEIMLCKTVCDWTTNLLFYQYIHEWSFHYWIISQQYWYIFDENVKNNDIF